MKKVTSSAKGKSQNKRKAKRRKSNFNGALSRHIAKRKKTVMLSLKFAFWVLIQFILDFIYVFYKTTRIMITSVYWLVIGFFEGMWFSLTEHQLKRKKGR